MPRGVLLYFLRQILMERRDRLIWDSSVIADKNLGVRDGGRELDTEWKCLKTIELPCIRSLLRSVTFICIASDINERCTKFPFFSCLPKNKRLRLSVRRRFNSSIVERIRSGPQNESNACCVTVRGRLKAQEHAKQLNTTRDEKLKLTTRLSKWHSARSLSSTCETCITLKLNPKRKKKNE